MATKKFTELTELSSVDDSDVVPIVDVSDTTDSATGTSKKITKANLVPSKATGTEINTGTDDAKFATAKAIADSNIAFIADIPVKASGSEADAGTNDAKFLTAKAVADSHNVPSVAPGTTGNVLTSDGTDWTSAASSGLPDVWVPNGAMINGLISATVASNNLTVAIKTHAGTDPSATDVVYCYIGGAIRSITAALSVTAAAGTNWFSSGSAELATKECDYFVYLGYNATDGVVIGFCPMPYMRSYGEFSVTSTEDRYGKISTVTNAASTDAYTVVGRFAATLSAGAGYTWTVPTFTSINLIHSPIRKTRWLNAIASATGFSSLSSNVLSYMFDERVCLFSASIAGTSNADTFTFYIPRTGDYTGIDSYGFQKCLLKVTNSGAAAVGIMQSVNYSTKVVTLKRSIAAETWATSAAKGLDEQPIFYTI